VISVFSVVNIAIFKGIIMTSSSPLHIVTGAFGYTGRYVARDLLAQDVRVRTLTNHPNKNNPFGDRIEIAPLAFDDPAALARSLEGADALYNTYWVRFSYGGTTFDQAVENTKSLVRAAKEAGVKRLVHVSIANPDPNSSLPYYRGKGQLEAFIQESGLSYAILRPAVLFGGDTAAEDVLLNNIAWLLRRFPVFAVPGDGKYRIQPIHVEDMARLAISQGAESENVVVNAVGPETYTFNEQVALLKKTVGSRALIVNVPPALGLLAAQIISPFLGDVLLTRQEVDGLLADLLAVETPPTGSIRLSDWLAANRELIGARYASEVGRHFK
jgi:NADH dehydrogenase